MARVPQANTAVQGSPPAINIVQTTPDTITFHRIQDHELELLTNISRPIALSLAGAVTGVFFAFVPATISAFQDVSGVDAADMIYVGLCFAAFALAAVFWPVAIAAQKKTGKTLKDIRARPTIAF